MKLRIDETGLRFRLSVEELDQLRAGRSVATPLPGYAVEMHPAASHDGRATLEIGPAGIALTVPGKHLAALSGIGLSRKGVRLEAGDIPVALQLDVRSAARAARRAE